jgi:hypothetical protein
MAAATLSVGALLAILEAAPEIRVPSRVDSHHSSKLGGKSQGGRNQPYREVRSVSASLWIAPGDAVSFYRGQDGLEMAPPADALPQNRHKVCWVVLASSLSGLADHMTHRV